MDAVRAPFVYQGPIARALRGVKFSGWRAVAADLAPAMAEVFDLEGEVVTWVPLARRRRARRGFDQAEVLARAVAPRLDLPVGRLLRRIKETPPQARRPGAERLRSLAEVFVAEGSVPASVVLIDDVVTTGATAAACAEALRRNGARTVVVLALARSLRAPPPARCYASGPTASRKGADGALL